MRCDPCAALGAIASRAESNPQAAALIDPNGLTLSYAEFWAQIVAVGLRLEESGIRFQETVAILLPQGARQLIAILGALKHCVCAPLQPRTIPTEVEMALNKVAASALITSPEFEAAAQAAIASGLTILVARNGESPTDWHIRRSVSSRKGRIASSEAVLVLVTSATTARSKVVPLTAENLDAGSEARRDSLQLTASDRMLLMTSLSHIIGVENVLAQFAAGGTVIATTGFDPDAYVHWLDDLRPTWYDCAPIVHQAALAQLRRGLPDQPISLRFLQSAGAPLPDDVRQELEQILHLPVFNDYGMTEACPIAFDSFLPGGRVPESAGRSCGLRIGIMNASRELLPISEEGEIVVRGPAVFPGYEDDAEANRKAFYDGWFRTGDLGRLDAHGNLFLTGRLKEMINRGGEKILPGEVDEVFASHPAVSEAAAFSVPHPTLGEDVACAVVLRSGAESEVSARELRRYATQSLASFKIPHRIYFVEEIPRGELGKPQRWVLAEQLSTRPAAGPTPAEITEQALADPIILVLQEIWARILNREDLGLDEDFFEAGGDSLATVAMLAEVDHRYGSQTSAAAGGFVDEPSLTHLAVLVRDTLTEHPPAEDGSRNMQLFPVDTGDSGTQLFCIPPQGIEGLAFRRLSKHLRGEIDLVVARPVNTQYSRSLFTFERYGMETAALIRQVQPVGPYFVSGWCFGGIVAVEAARQLAQQGQEVRVILFDVPTPGIPGLLSQWRSFLEGVKRQLHLLFTSKHPGLTYNLRELCRRVLWSWMIPIRRILLPVEHVPFVQRTIQWGQDEYFPYYKARPVDALFLHILSTIDSANSQSVSRFGWKSIARGGIEERYLTLDNWNFFHGSNLPAIADVLIRWCGIQSKATRQDHPTPEVGTAEGARH